MKNILAIMILAIALVSCEKEKVTKLDPLAPVYLNGREAPQKGSKGDEALSIKEVIKQSTYFGCYGMFPTIMTYYTIDGACERDTINNRIVGYSNWVITDEGYLQTEFIEARDFILLNWDREEVRDTLGYIPNSIMEQAEIDIKAAYDAQDIEECYRLFQEAFIFYPITGSGYLELVDQGLN